MMVLGSVAYRHWRVLEPTLTPQAVNSARPHMCQMQGYIHRERVALVIRHEQFRIASVGWGLAPGVQPEAYIGANMVAELEVSNCWFR